MNTRLRSVERRLAAIVYADVAGYTRLMNADEAGTLRLLTSHRVMIERLIPQHGGRIANTAGDSVLAEFPSAVDALQCALGIQERVAATQEEVSEDRRVSFRIGIHVGEAMVQGRDLFGDAVNVAARMQAIAEPGTVCLSGSAHEYVHKVLPVTFEDLGPRAVKNIETPIRAYRVRLSGPPLARTLPPIQRHSEYYLVRRFHDALFEAFDEAMGGEDISRFELAILAVVYDVPDVELQQLAKRLAIEFATVEQLAHRLQDRGLVCLTSDPNHENSRGFSLTPKGLDLFNRLYPASVAARDRVMAPLSDEERNTLHELLARVIKGYETARRGNR
jgi:class 3 adenylate cyclase/DNA-binding MarR family transcriptional regulator